MIFIPETQVILTLYWEFGFHPRFANWELGFPHIVVGNWDWDFILDMQILVGTLSIKTHWDFVRWDFVCLPTGSISNKEGLEQSLAKMMECLFRRTHNLSKQVHIASNNCFVYKTTLSNNISPYTK